MKRLPPPPYMPVAIVGSGCRFPKGADTADRLWQALCDGVDAVGATPAQRWDVERYHDADAGRPGTTYCREGAFLDSVDGFDAGFFGFTPGEAREIDPQQRLLLEVAWESLADAGMPVRSLRGSRTGVFVGMLGMDYLALHSREVGPEGINPYYATGKEFSFGAGRLAYHIGAHGPALTVSTACSSSLVAIHLACRALANGEADLALAGGVNLMLAPDLTLFMSQVRAISPTGRCHVFDAAADGIVRGEGCGLVVLKRLADARADGDDIRAVILGSAINHDGPSAGQTVPNGAAQIAVIREALAAARVSPADIGYVEAHGTGTPLGDPIELDALGQVFQGRPDKLPVGSLKANFGHMDAAAGIASVIKVASVLRHGEIPPQIHVERLNPAIDWTNGPLTVATARRSWPDGHAVRLAGVSAFGLSGTNVHIVLSQPPADAQAPAPTPVSDRLYPCVLPLSARSAEALRVQAGRHADWLAQADPALLPDILHTAARRRDHYAHRAALVGGDAPALIQGLRALADATGDGAIAQGRADEDQVRRPVFVYTGQGSQWAGVATDLLDRDPIFAEVIRRCDAAMAEIAGWSIATELRRPADSSRLHRTEIAQPVIFAIQAGLTERWRQWGIVPAATTGHSMGEVAAAWCAGALDLEQAVRVIHHRAHVMRNTAGGGKMLATGLGAAEAAARVAGLEDVEIAAVNGPASTVLAGARAPLAALAETLARDNVFALFLPGEYAFHSRQMEACQSPLIGALADLAPREAGLPWVSTSGPVTEAPRANARYWADNIRQPVAFQAAIDHLAGSGHRVFLEIGPHAVLATPIRQCLEAKGREARVASALLRGKPGTVAMAEALAGLYTAGCAPDWNVLQPEGRLTSLPAYPWQRKRYWFDRPERATAGLDPAGLVAQVRVLDRQGRVVAEAGGLPLTGATGSLSTHGAAVAAAGATETAPITPAAHTPPPDKAGLETGLEDVVRDLLGLEAGQPIDRDRGFFELGLDSIALVGLRQKVQARFGHALPATVGFDYPTIRRLAAFVAEREADCPSAPAPTAAAMVAMTAAPASARPEPIAVIGLACRLPGADTPDDFWTLLEEGRCAVGDAPAGRWSSEDYPQAGQGRYPARGAFLADPAGFDADFFKISPREARSLDPQQRLFLMVAWEALERAGIPPDHLTDSRTGVYAGVNSHDYDLRIAADPALIDAHYGTGTSFSAIPGRLSHTLGLHGPSVAVDTACSSSLTALHLACQGLRAGDCNLAIVGGVNIIASPAIFLSMGDAGALAPDGVCKTFDDRADGYGRGEGCGVAILKPLSRAQADGDHVIATILGSAVNHDGPSGGLTVPNGPAQRDLIRQALTAAGLAPAEIGYVEAHGTGTVLGDPIEIQAMDAAYRVGRAADAPLRVGSVKANIGHLEAAAGIAAFLKVCLSLERGRVPPHPHLGTLNQRVDWSQLALRIPTRAEDWAPRTARRVAGVSAFGFTGTNAHLVVASADATRPRSGDTPAGRTLPLVLSARSEAALRAHAANTAAHLRARRPAIDGMCRTAALRRAALPARLAVLGHDADSLAAALDTWLAHGQADTWRAQADEEMRRCVETFLAGDTPDWRVLWPENAPPADLPTYPWQRTPFWIDPAPRGRARGQDPSGDTHPLLRHRRPGSDGTARWESPLDADTPDWVFLPDAPNRRLRPAALAEAALAAADRAFGPGCRTLRDIDFADPSRGSDIAGATLCLDLIPGDGDTLALRIALRPPNHGAPRLLASATLIAAGNDDIVHDTATPPRQADLTQAEGEDPRARRVKLIEASFRLLAPDSEGAVRSCARILALNDLPDHMRLLHWTASPEAAAEIRLADPRGATLVRVAGPCVAAEPAPQAPTAPSGARALGLDWTEATPPDSAAPPPAGFWLLIEDETGRAKRLTEACAARGIVLRPVAAPLDERRLTRLLREQAGNDQCLGLVHAGGLGLPPGIPERPDAALAPPCRTILDLAHAVSHADIPGKPVWFVTEQAQAPRGAPRRPIAAGLWGIARAFGLENPAWWGGLIDLDLEDRRDAHRFADLLATGSGHDHCLIRAGRLHHAHVVEAPWPEAAPPAVPPNATAILHDLDPALADPLLAWLERLGFTRVALLGGADPGPAAPAHALAIQHLDANPADETAVAAALADLRARGPIAGVVHAGADWTLAPLAALDGDTLAQTLARRVTGMAILHRLTRSDPLAFFLTFASAASLWGGMGLGLAAAADAALDAMAHHRRALGLPALGIDWTQWRSALADRPEDLRLMRRSGLTPLSDATVIDGLDRLAGSDAVQVAVAEADWTVLKPLYQARLAWPILDRLGGGAAKPATLSRDELADLSPDLRLHRLTRHVRETVAEVFGFDDPARLDPRRGFFDLGMTSVMAVDLRARLERLTGLSLSSTFAFEHTTIEAAARALHDGFGLALPDRAETEAPAEDDLSESDLIAALDRELDDLDMGPAALATAAPGKESRS